MAKTLLPKIMLEAPARILNPNEVFASIETDSAENLDIMYVGFTLCHEGSNTNGDRFTLDEMKKAWKTIAHKPINWEHTEPNIGVVLDAGLKVPASANSTTSSREPAQIDCVGAVWKTRYPEYSNFISRASQDNSLKVSMEAYFSGADFVLGEYEEVIEECDADEDLASLLGTFFDGKFVSRALKNVIFGGVGITASPADDKARIWACAFEKSDEEYHEYLHDAFEGRKMSVMTKDIIIAEHEKVTLRLANTFLKEGN